MTPTLQSLALLSVDALTALANETPNRQLSICATQLVHAKRAKIAGEDTLSAQHVQAARTAYARSLSAETQLQAVARTQGVVEARGVARDATKGKSVAVGVVAPRAGAVWKDSWARAR